MKSHLLVEMKRTLVICLVLFLFVSAGKYWFIFEIYFNLFICFFGFTFILFTVSCQLSVEGNLQDLGRLVDGVTDASGRATDALVRRRREAKSGDIDSFDDMFD